MEKYDIFLYIPIKARNFNYSFVKKAKLKNRYAFVWTSLDQNKKINNHICNVAFNVAENHFDDYLFFSWDLPFETIPINSKLR